MRDRDASRREGARITHTRVATKDDGRRAFRPGEDVSQRREVSGRENVPGLRGVRTMAPIDNVRTGPMSDARGPGRTESAGPAVVRFAGSRGAGRVRRRRRARR